MKVKISAAFVLSLTLLFVGQSFGVSYAQDGAPPNAWRSLVPLKSTRADVEKLFGAAQDVTGQQHSYKLKTESVSFTYAKGNCSPSDEGWNLAPGTILEINVLPQAALSASEAGLDLSNFLQTATDSKELSLYTNPENGVTVRTKGGSAIVAIKYGASSRDVSRACAAN